MRKNPVFATAAIVVGVSLIEACGGGGGGNPDDVEASHSVEIAQSPGGGTGGRKNCLLTMAHTALSDVEDGIRVGDMEGSRHGEEDGACEVGTIIEDGELGMDTESYEDGLADRRREWSTFLDGVVEELPDNEGTAEIGTGELFSARLIGHVTNEGTVQLFDGEDGRPLGSSDCTYQSGLVPLTVHERGLEFDDQEFVLATTDQVASAEPPCDQPGTVLLITVQE